MLMMTRCRPVVIAMAVVACAVAAAADHGDSAVRATPVPDNYPNMTLAHSVLMYAYAAFCDDAVLEAWNCVWCARNPSFVLTSILYNSSAFGETRGYVGYDASANSAIVSFRGSDNGPNWILDLEPGKRDFHGTTVHKGWKQGFDILAPQMYAALAKVIAACPLCETRVIVTGHSLGAAIAGLAAMDIAIAEMFDAVNMIDFGMPRAGELDFANLFRAVVPYSLRFVHHHDIVPHFPPEWEAYHHVGTEIWNKTNVAGTPLVVCNGSGEDPSCSDSVPFFEYKPSDHMNYLGEQLDSNLGCQPAQLQHQ